MLTSPFKMYEYVVVSGRAVKNLIYYVICKEYKNTILFKTLSFLSINSSGRHEMFLHVSLRFSLDLGKDLKIKFVMSFFSARLLVFT